MKIASSASHRLPFWLALLLLESSVTGFPAPFHHHTTGDQRTLASNTLALAAVAGDGETWENLLPEIPAAPVRKAVLEAAAADAAETPSKGSTVTIEYSGSLWMDPDSIGCSIPSWDTNAVLKCWLAEQQGLDELVGPFEEHSVDGSKLLDEERFTEAFVGESLGVDNKIRCKKTIMAAKRLRTTLKDFEHGLVFDSTDSKPNQSYSFVLGEGKTIKAMELLVASMNVGETSRVVTRCDYGYGADGFRTSKGDVLVPPFCGLQFDVKLVSVR